MINLDANASQTLLPEVQEALSAWAHRQALNPSSVHSLGQRARAMVEEARGEIAALLNLGKGDRVVFTSGATEANNTALMLPFWEELQVGPARTQAPEDPLCRILSGAIEHPSVLAPLERLKAFGIRSALLAPGREDFFCADSFLELCGEETALLSLMLANNESGQIFPVAQIAAALKARQPNILVHSDAAQGLGKMKIDFNQLGADMLSISGHKIGALSGIGALILGPRARGRAFILGGAQEGSLRAGTENLLGIHSFGIAARWLRENLGRRIDAMQKGRDYLCGVLKEKLPRARVNFEHLPRLPNTLSLRLPGVRADDMVVALDLEGICISAGPACAAGKPEPSHVLKAMGLTLEEAQETVRISLEARYRDGELERAAEAIVKCVRQALAGKGLT